MSIVEEVCCVGDDEWAVLELMALTHILTHARTHA